MADMSLYLLGVAMAIGSGVLNNLGTVLNKKVVNEVNQASGEKFFRKLLTNPVWLTGLLLQLPTGTALFIVAVAWIGPALTPGLMAIGLIVLAFGAVRIAGEKLGKSEKIGIVLMIVGIFSLGYSNLSISIINFDYTEMGFVMRTIIFTGIAFFLCIAFKLISKKNKRFCGILLALISGLLISLSNFWISILLGTIFKVFGGGANWLQWVLFICACAILCSSNVLGLAQLQEAFKSGQASNLIPVQQVPIQITPVFYYFYIFMAFLYNPVGLDAIAWMLIGVVIIIISSFLLGKQQARMESIK
ncbi:MAG TPA: hypothetical protein VKM55_13175 [Candidatus Lokiarchaeia archaeon]|nr:hypothetical protein [Candidatus Lokiarchaeia archaeon]